MKTVRRLYFYAVALISVEVVLWGLINLLRSIVDETVGGAADALAQALALVPPRGPLRLVPVHPPVQRRDSEEPIDAGVRRDLAVLRGRVCPRVPRSRRAPPAP